MKGKEEASERMLNEIEASQLSDIEVKAMVIRKLNEVTENYQKLQGNYNGSHCKLYQHEKGNRNYQQGQEDMNNTISEPKDTVERTKSSLNEAEDQMREMKDKVEKKKTPRKIKKRKKKAQKE